MRVAAGFVYAIATRLYDRRIGFWSALAYVTLPGVSLSAFIISTDAVCYRAGRRRSMPLSARASRRASAGGSSAGIAAGLGLLAKYAMAYWLLSAFGFVLLAPEERRHLRRLLAATGIAMLIYLPNLWWNWSHGFVSFLHLRDNAELSGRLLHPTAFLEFLGSQFGVIGPLVFRRSDRDRCATPRPGRTARPAACRLCLADRWR